MAKNTSRVSDNGSLVCRMLITAPNRTPQATLPRMVTARASQICSASAPFVVIQPSHASTRNTE